jgi:hypothetical protein
MGYYWFVFLTLRISDLICYSGEELDLDGFVFQIKGPEYGTTIDQLCRTVKRVFKYLCDQDPARK